jgi:hypothetical protein
MPGCPTRLPIGADIAAGTPAAAPPAAGSAARSGRACLRIAAQRDAMRGTARIGRRHRREVARHHGIGPALAVLPLACDLDFDPDLPAAARAAEAATPPAPLCGEG